jgi:hypothetical protein
MTCSRRGECNNNGICECFSQYDGDACENTIYTSGVAIDGGSSGFEINPESIPESPEQVDISNLFDFPPSPVPTSVPTKSPTREPIVVREVEAQLSFSGISENEFEESGLKEVVVESIAATLGVDKNNVEIVSIEVETRRVRHLLAPGDLIITVKIRVPKNETEQMEDIETFEEAVGDSLSNLDSDVEKFVQENELQVVMNSVAISNVVEVSIPNTATPTLTPTSAPTDLPTPNPSSAPTDLPTPSPSSAPTLSTFAPTPYPSVSEGGDVGSGSVSKFLPGQLLKMWALYSATVALFAMVSSGL